MGRLKQIVWGALAAALALFAYPALCAGFQTDLDGIDRAAQSVLMLEVYDADNQMIATGSGFVVFDNRTLVTNNHVIEDAAFIIANSDTGSQYLINKVIAADAVRDIALLEFYSPTDLTPLALMPGQALRRAAPVTAIGSPKGVTNTVSLGNISALYEEGGVSYIQFTAPISHGSSGGALFDDAGRVIGITSMYVTDSQNMNLAVDIGEVVRLKDAGYQNARVSFEEHHARSKLPATPTPEPVATMAPAFTPAPDNTNEAGLMAMFTYDGVILRWENKPAAIAYEIYRWVGDDEPVYIGSVKQGVTYYLDTDAALEDQTYTYRLRVIFSEDRQKWSYSQTADATFLYTKKADLLPPDVFSVDTGYQWPSLTWQAADGADGYIVYRAPSLVARFEQVGWVLAERFTDWRAKPGAVYYYKVRSCYKDFISDLSEPVRMGAPTAIPVPSAGMEPETDIPLAIGDDGYIDVYKGCVRMTPGLFNSSAYRAVTGYSLTYYCQDAQKNTIPEKYTQEVYYTQKHSIPLGPGEKMYPAYALLLGYENVKYVNVAVTSVTYQDGTTVDIPEADWQFYFWTLE